MKRHLYNIFFTVIAGMAVLCGSCTHEDTDISPVSSGIAVNMSIETEANDGIQSGTDSENAIERLRVYAYRSEKQVGYYYSSNSSAISNFWMDLEIPAGTGNVDVDFYVIANEHVCWNSPGGEMASGSVYFREKMTKKELEDFHFAERRLATTGGTTLLLPMSVKVTRNLNTDNVNFAAGTGTHDGHHQLQENALKFELIRCVSKLEMYFAKGAECGLTVNSIALQKEGICDWAYVTEPTEEMLKNIPHTFTNELTLLEEPAVIEKILLEGEMSGAELDRYVNVLETTPFYLFENYYGADDTNTPGDANGYKLTVSYTLDGAPGTKDIYLPPTKRNTIYRVLNWVPRDGVVSVVYTVDDWDDSAGDAVVDFVYPEGYSFTPFFAGDVPDRFSTEVCFSDDSSKEITTRFKFRMPSGTMSWTPSLGNGDSNQFEVKVYKNYNTAQQEEVSYPVPTGDTEYVIEIRARQSLLQAGIEHPEVEFCIRTRLWGLENIALPINRNEDWPWMTETKKDSHIKITQGLDL